MTIFMHATNKLAVWAVAIPLWMMTGLAVYWGLVDTQCPIRPIHIAAEVQPTQDLRPGAFLIVRRVYDVSVAGNYTITRHLIDHVVHRLPAAVVKLEAGHHDRVVELQLPELLTPGLYNYTVEICHQNNPIYQSCVSLDPEQFYILQSNGKRPDPLKAVPLKLEM